jgi:hypothetical protein
MDNYIDSIRMKASKNSKYYVNLMNAGIKKSYKIYYACIVNLEIISYLRCHHFKSIS